jgi:hypothetical protein
VPAVVTNLTAYVDVADQTLSANWVDPTDLGGGTISYYSVFYLLDDGVTWSDEYFLYCMAPPSLPSPPFPSHLEISNEYKQ